nr:hypothetical protein [Nanoarchaeum sp.]
MKKKKDDENEKGIVESFLGGMPVFGDFFKELAKTETFKERFKEVDEKIEENLRKGYKKKWGFEANISVRPIFNEVKEETSEITISEDYFYGKKGDNLTLAVKVPKEDVDLKIKGKDLLITSDNFEKKIVLPGYFRSIKRKQYKEGILVLELTK